MTATADRDVSDAMRGGSFGTVSRIDMRCSASVSVALPRGGDATPSRCQLLAGHDGAHALMFSDARERRVLGWTTDHEPEDVIDWMRRPWMRGFPFPAWFASSATA